MESDDELDLEDIYLNTENHWKRWRKKFNQRTK